MDPSIYRLRQCDVLTLCVIALLGLGVIMVQSASANISGQTQWHWTTVGIKHARFAAAALAVFLVVGHIDYRRLVRRSGWFNPVLWLLLAGVLACTLVLIPHIGIEKNGARRWLPLGPLGQLQPSELAKWGVVAFLAWWFAYRPIDLNRFRNFLLTWVPVGTMCLLVVIQDFGTAALIAVAALLICLAGRAKLWHMMVVFPPALAAGFWFVHHKAYRWTRMVAFLDPFAAPRKEGYHMIQSLFSFDAGLFGRGLGNGIQKLGYLPEDTTDFIFAIICEEMGLFGALLTIALYVGIIYVAAQVIRQKRDSFGRLLAFGVAVMIGLQALINIAVATVSVPTKGLSLPLISFGGSGLIITCAALGLLYSVARHEHSVEEEAKPAEWNLDSAALAGAL